MSALIAIAVPCLSLARAWRARLWALQRAFGVDLHDLALVIRTPRGRWRIRRSPSPHLAGALGGAFWSALVGGLMGAPLLSALLGALAGAAYGSRVNFGLAAVTLRALAQELAPGEAAIVFLARRIDLAAALAEWAPLRGSGRLLHAELPNEDAAILRQFLDSVR